MNGILQVITHNILPIFLVGALGFWLRRSQQIDPRPLASVVFNGFSPALVFSALVSAQLPLAELTDLTLFAVLTILLMGLVGVAVGRMMRLSRVNMAVLLLMLMFVNSGNYGLTLNQLRYGDQGLSRAIVYYTVSSIMVYTLGVFIVSMGRQSWRQSLRRLATLPAVYAVLLGLLVYASGIHIPDPLMQAIDIAAAGAIPAMIIVLGMNIAEVPRLEQLRLTVPAISLRLVVGPLVAFSVAAWIGLQGLNRSTSIIEASMPPGVLTTVLATEFDVQPALVTSIVVLSTLLSPITLALFINLFTL